MSILFEHLDVGALRLPNRIVMAPMTRCRAGETRIPNALMAQYYTQRAAAGLIITEATSVTPMGIGYAGTPGIWSAEQVEGWKLTTKAVHEAGGRIFLQLWHVGRVSHPMFLNGDAPVAPSAIAASGNVSQVRPPEPYPVPRELELSEIPGMSRPIGAARRTPRPPVSTASGSTAPTAICSTNSCRTSPTIAPTPMAAPSRTARG